MKTCEIRGLPVYNSPRAGDFVNSEDGKRTVTSSDGMSVAYRYTDLREIYYDFTVTITEWQEMILEEFVSAHCPRVEEAKQ